MVIFNPRRRDVRRRVAIYDPLLLYLEVLVNGNATYIIITESSKVLCLTRIVNVRDVV